MPKITPCLWFDGNGEQAAEFYVSVFKNSKILSTSRYTQEGNETHHQPAKSVMTVEFELDGQKYIALNAGPMFKFNEAISFQVDCKTQEEVDYYWEKLSANGGNTSRCGWLKDQFGVSWQVVPSIMPQLMVGPDTEKVSRVVAAVMKMMKLDIAALQKAANGE